MAISVIETLKNLENRYFEFTMAQIPIYGGTLNTTSVPLLRRKEPVVDVYRDFKWKNSTNYNEIPSISLIEHQLTLNSLAAGAYRVFNLARQAGSVFSGTGNFSNAVRSGLDPYAAIYAKNPLFDQYCFKYNLPLLRNRRGVTNSWENEESLLESASSEIGKVIGGMAKTALQYSIGNAGYVGIEPVKQYKNTDYQIPIINFTLYNTGTPEEAYNNFIFVNLFTFQNLKSRTSLFTYLPPKAYTVYTSKGYGGYYCPLAALRNFVVEDVGPLRAIKYNVGADRPLLLPEAYNITIEFQELVPTSQNTFQGAISNNLVNVLTEMESIPGLNVPGVSSPTSTPSTGPTGSIQIEPGGPGFPRL